MQLLTAEKKELTWYIYPTILKSQKATKVVGGIEQSHEGRNNHPLIQSVITTDNTYAGGKRWLYL